MAFDQGHALVIGVGSHQLSPWLDVPITVEDARAVEAQLKDSRYCGYPQGQVQLLHDETATKEGILAALDKLAARATPESTVFLFYCGHGALGTDGKYYLVAHDASMKDDRVVAGSGVSEEELVQKLKALPARRVLAVFNACFSGHISPTLSSGQHALAASVPPAKVTTALLGTGSGRIIITAAREEQPSYIGNGKLTIFTDALVQGLQGRGSVSNRSGFISAFGLYEHLYDAVKEKVEQVAGAVQEPELTVVKGVGPFAVALYKGASSLGTFAEDEPLPQTPGVREVRPEKVERVFNQYVVQTGGLNLGQGNDINITGDLYGGDQVQGDKIDARGSSGAIFNPTGTVNQSFGPTTHIKADGAIVGNISHIGRDFIGRDYNGAQQPTADTAETLRRLINALRSEIGATAMSGDEKQAALQDLDGVTAQLNSDTPRLSLIKRSLASLRSLLEDAQDSTGRARRIVTQVDLLTSLAQKLFG